MRGVGRGGIITIDQVLFEPEGRPAFAKRIDQLGRIGAGMEQDVFGAHGLRR